MTWPILSAERFSDATEESASSALEDFAFALRHLTKKTAAPPNTIRKMTTTPTAIPVVLPLELEPDDAGVP